MNISLTLEQEPALMATCAEAIAIEKNSVEEAKHLLEIAEAKATITHCGEKNATLTKARVSMDPAVIECKEDLIKAIGRLETAKIPYEQHKERFMAAHTLAKLEIEERRAWGTQTVKDNNRQSGQYQR